MTDNRKEWRSVANLRGAFHPDQMPPGVSAPPTRLTLLP